MLFFLDFPLEFQNIPRLAIQNVADGLQSGETDGADMAVFELGQVYIGNANFFGQFIEAHFSVSHDPVKT